MATDNNDAEKGWNPWGWKTGKELDEEAAKDINTSNIGWTDSSLVSDYKQHKRNVNKAKKDYNKAVEEKINEVSRRLQQRMWESDEHYQIRMAKEVEKEMNEHIDSYYHTHTESDERRGVDADIYDDEPWERD
jgi:23S rRNA G2069 N7-methylase RlmK/C1962 C5-methylase RlmI